MEKQKPLELVANHGISYDLSLFVSGDSPIRTQCMHKGPVL